MQVSIIGAGYVGLVTAACLAEVGHSVVCLEADAHKVARLQAGECPIYEPGLAELLARNLAAGRIYFTLDPKQAVSHATCLFIAVGTPPDEDGSADLRYVLQAARQIATYLTDYRLVVTKSTVPVGTGDKVRAAITETLQNRQINVAFDVASNPEFLKEGAAIADFMQPDRIVIGVQNDKAKTLLTELYAPFNQNGDRLISMDIRSAELSKYAANALLATKISFMNELSRLAEKVGADIEQVRASIGRDVRIGPHFIAPGCGYGGSCFPKDVQALAHMFTQEGLANHIITAVETVNQQQKQVLFEKLQQHFGHLQNKTIAVWGLAFKPHTDDMREASSRALIERLWQAGARVRAYDPIARAECQRLYGTESALTLCHTATEALQEADALVIVTEWPEFKQPDFNLIRQHLLQPVIIDGRNLYDASFMQQQGFTYYSIGRTTQVKGA